VDRRFDQHLDIHELEWLVPAPTDAADPEPMQPGLTAEAFTAAASHVVTCEDCRQKLERYWRVVSLRSETAVSAPAALGADCPRDVDWFEVVMGLWPEMKARQLIMHAALCSHCGPMLREAASLNADPTPKEEEFLAQLAPPTRPFLNISPSRQAPATAPLWAFMKWAIPAAVAMIVTGFILFAPGRPISGEGLAEIAASTHEQHVQGTVALDVRTDSQQQLDDWLKVNLPFQLPLPSSPEIPGEHRPYRLEGARLVQVRGKPAVYISYVAQNDPVSLLVTPDSTASPSGGVVVDYKKVSFHYRIVNGYKVVTWSLKGRTYALVSHEGHSTQRSCMVCHSAMGDRDLTNTPTPLSERLAKPAFQ
jgi:anti-sigma factor RsiW